MKDSWLIWSIEHSGWWLPGYKGYTQNRNEAGRYALTEAMRIVEDANRYLKADELPNESLVYANMIPVMPRPKPLAE